jgi:hypothetical protein
MQIKGTGIRSLFEAIRKLRGEEGLAAVLEAVPADVRDELEPRVVASRFYPVRVSASLQQAVHDTIGHGHWTLSHQLGVEAAHIDFSGVYRIFIRTLGDDTLWNAIERAFQQYNSQGEAKWLDRRRGRARGVVTGVEGYNEGMWQSVAGRVEGLLTLAGARGASVEVRNPRPDGCELEAIWLLR